MCVWGGGDICVLQNMERGKSEERPAPFSLAPFNFPLWPHKGETLGNKTWPATGPLAKKKKKKVDRSVAIWDVPL